MSARTLLRAGRGRGDADTVRAVHQAASLLLGYPGDDFARTVAEVEAALRPLPDAAAAPLRRFCAAVAPLPALEAAARYVRTFDRSRRRTLHLTYYADGDTRRRGASLARLKSLYGAHGWRSPDDELPDFLPLVLEFAARCPGPGRDLLHEHRAALALLHAALRRCASPYADVLAAVRGTLPARGAAGPLPPVPDTPAPLEGARR